MQQGNFINVFLARHVSGTYTHHQEHYMLSCSIRFSAPSFWKGGGLESRFVGRVQCRCCHASRIAASAPHTWSRQWLSRPPPFQILGAENHMLQLNIECSWWWAYAPETCQAKNTLIKLPCCINLAFQVITWGRCTVKQPWSLYPGICLYSWVKSMEKPQCTEKNEWHLILTEQIAKTVGINENVV